MGAAVATRYARIPALSFQQRTADEARVDVVLFDRVIGGDPTALSELYDKHHQLLFGLILRILRIRDEAEDVLQEVFVQAWTKAGTYNAKMGSPAGWLVGIARNRAIDRLRSNATRFRTSETLSAPQAPVAKDTPETQAFLGEQQVEIQRALDTLPLEQSDLIRHAYFHGLSHSELADRFSLPLGTVKTRIRTGLHAVRVRLEGRLSVQ